MGTGSRAKRSIDVPYDALKYPQIIITRGSFPAASLRIFPSSNGGNWLDATVSSVDPLSQSTSILNAVRAGRIVSVWGESGMGGHFSVSIRPLPVRLAGRSDAPRHNRHPGLTT